MIVRVLSKRLSTRNKEALIQRLPIGLTALKRLFTAGYLILMGTERVSSVKSAFVRCAFTLAPSVMPPRKGNE